VEHFGVFKNTTTDRDSIRLYPWENYSFMYPAALEAESQKQLAQINARGDSAYLGPAFGGYFNIMSQARRAAHEGVNLILEKLDRQQQACLKG
jgi:hypothetical protein